MRLPAEEAEGLRAWSVGVSQKQVFREDLWSGATKKDVYVVVWNE